MSYYEKYSNKLQKLSPKRLKRELFNDWLEIIEIIKKNDKEKEFLQFINKNFKTKYSSLNQITNNSKSMFMKESAMGVSAEDVHKLWEFIDDWFFSIIKVEDTFIDSFAEWIFHGVKNSRKLAVSGILFLILITGKFFQKFSQENSLSFLSTEKKKKVIYKIVSTLISSLFWLKKGKKFNNLFGKDDITYGSLFEENKLIMKYLN
jgi:hypothetical protein